MKFSSRLVVALAVFTLVPCVTNTRAQEPAAAAAHFGDKLFIETSTAPVFLGKATLKVDTLRRAEGIYSGTYEIQVSPLSVASEKGKLSVTFPDEAIQSLREMKAASFHGQGTNTNGKNRTIDGRATPKAVDRGDLTLKILSERGKLVFHTTYHF